jgi:hypothetical protein
MTNIKTLTLAAVAALSLGIGTAMAQESSGAVGPYERLQLERALSGIHHASPVTSLPQAGSSDFDQIRAPVYPQQTLFGQDGNGWVVGS